MEGQETAWMLAVEKSAHNGDRYRIRPTVGYTAGVCSPLNGAAELFAVRRSWIYWSVSSEDTVRITGGHDCREYKSLESSKNTRTA